jgi:hypothetical protein
LFEILSVSSLMRATEPSMRTASEELGVWELASVAVVSTVSVLPLLASTAEIIDGAQPSSPSDFK